MIGEISKGRLIINWQLRAEFENLQIDTSIRFRVYASGAICPYLLSPILDALHDFCFLEKKKNCTLHLVAKLLQ